ncbi:hypothetical protein [Nostoc sp.]|uniref:hypothetical protein n=1 Tax=Nostoc sp. TaxID=1180 RepID=UPI002FF97187
MLSPVFDEFVEASPVTVMMRGLMEEIFNSSRMNQLFETYSERQYSQELLFSTQVEGRVRRSSSISPVAKILLKLLYGAIALIRPSRQ